MKLKAMLPAFWWGRQLEAAGANFLGRQRPGVHQNPRAPLEGQEGHCRGAQQRTSYASPWVLSEDTTEPTEGVAATLLKPGRPSSCPFAVGENFQLRH